MTTEDPQWLTDIRERSRMASEVSVNVARQLIAHVDELRAVSDDPRFLLDKCHCKKCNGIRIVARREPPEVIL